MNRSPVVGDAELIEVGLSNVTPRLLRLTDGKYRTRTKTRSGGVGRTGREGTSSYAASSTASAEAPVVSVAAFVFLDTRPSIRECSAFQSTTYSFDLYGRAAQRDYRLASLDKEPNPTCTPSCVKMRWARPPGYYGIWA